MIDSALTPALREQVGGLDPADVVVAILHPRDEQTLATVRRAAAYGLAHDLPDVRPVILVVRPADPDGAATLTVDTPEGGASIDGLLGAPRHPARILWLTTAGDAPGGAGRGHALRTAFEIASALDARALAVLDGSVGSAVPEWIDLLAGPVLAGRADFVAPRSIRHPFDGPITNLVVYPVIGAMFGQRVRQPIVGEFAVGADLIDRLLAGDATTWSSLSTAAVDAWLMVEAIGSDARLMEARLGTRAAIVAEMAELGDAFVEITTTLADALDRHAERWSPPAGEARGLPAYGFDRQGDPPAVRVDPVRYLAEFEDGARTFRDAWLATLSGPTASAVLSLAVTAAGVGLSARDWLNLDRGADIARLDTTTLANAIATFHFPDDVWARVVFDAMLAAQRSDQPADVLRPIVPIFLGRAASFIVETRRASNAEAEDVVERQALEFERLAPEFIARRHSRTGAASGSPGEQVVSR